MDCLIIGGGIVGAACARELARAGATVDLLEADYLGSGATSAGMGHLVTLQGVPGELEFTRHGVEAWRREADELKRAAEYVQTGTLWIASGPSEVELLEQQSDAFAAAGVDAELLTRTGLVAAEPALAEAACAGLRVPGDAIIYAPKAAQWLGRQSCDGRLRVHQGVRVTRVGQDWAEADDGRRFAAAHVIIAAGLQAKALLPDLPLVAKRGHLMITDRYPGMLRHHVLEIGYAASTHAQSSVSVSFNVQPRPTGQILIGSSREIGVESASEDPAIVRQLARRAMQFLPGLAEVSVLRAWTGVRAASASGMPIIGRAKLPGPLGLVWVAAGHEGLGVSTALVTASIVRSRIVGESLPEGLEQLYGEGVS
ncbi:FAD-binding oxidoreductase [Thiomonas sp. FB-Cd]|uniref:NAD(P)/FAD-dependent oxidoreductase n=1 Tax=Thiomonas sp. FB-Cd TaxID=1158292 RepID=UPI000AE1EB06|nr:FAD-dependent oxidoreductase [Thiomonas sp. FB-Cd]